MVLPCSIVVLEYVAVSFERFNKRILCNLSLIVAYMYSRWLQAKETEREGARSFLLFNFGEEGHLIGRETPFV